MNRRLNEETINDLKNTPYNPSEDKLNQYHITDTRKPIITLMDIHRLKLLINKKKFDQQQQNTIIQKIYQIPSEEDDSSF